MGVCTADRGLGGSGWKELLEFLQASAAGESSFVLLWKSLSMVSVLLEATSGPAVPALLPTLGRLLSAWEGRDHFLIK